MLKNIHGHTIDLELLTGGWVLDVGCLGFQFSQKLAKLKEKVIACDPNPTIEDPKLPNVTFLKIAIVGEKDPNFKYLVRENPTTNRLSLLGTIDIEQITIPELMSTFKIDQFDVVKLDCEKCEYGILKKWQKNWATQLSVEFHHDRMCQPIKHLKYYQTIQENRHDSLFVLRKPHIFL